MTGRSPALFNSATDEEKRRYIERYGLTEEQLRAEVDDPQDEAIMIVVVGSIVAGFGNATSDFDLVAVVEDGRDVSGFPITSFVNGKMIDVEYKSARVVRRYVSTVRELEFARRKIGERTWKALPEILRTLSRIESGLILKQTVEWERMFGGSFPSQLAQKICEYWWLDSQRRMAFAEWALQDAPFMSVIRCREALICACDAVLALSGAHYWGPKWLSEKIRHANDGTLYKVAAYANSVADYLNERAPECVSRTRSLLDSIAAEKNFRRVRLALHVGCEVKSYAFGDRVMLSYHGLKGASLPQSFMQDESGLLWEGDACERPSEGLLKCVRRRLLWVQPFF